MTSIETEKSELVNQHDAYKETANELSEKLSDSRNIETQKDTMISSL